MRKVLLSFLLISLLFKSQAQDAKPTKQQTIEYLTNTLKGFTSNFIWSDQEEITENDTITSIGFRDCNTIIKYKSIDPIGSKKYLTYNINLKELDDIKIERIESGKKYYQLHFISYNSQKLIKENYQFFSGLELIKDTEMYKSAVTIPAPNDEKLVKAFNHLRKLCGAPEPIKF